MSDTVLRNRKSSSGSSSTETLKAFMDSVVAKAPEKLRPQIEMAVPYIFMVANGIEASIPIIYSIYLKLHEVWVLLAPYKPELLLPSLIGLAMCFFGGTFLTVIAAAEAYRMVGYQTTLRCIKDLHEDLTKFLAANKEDDEKDEDGNGVPDAKEISSQELVTRKTLLFLRTVDPKRITDAIAGINAGFLAVIATLKLQFAKAITLGSSIASILEVPVFRFCLPILENSIPPEYKKWAAPLLSYTVQSIAISIAWFIQRVISSIHSGIRGGMMFSRNILEYLDTMGYMKINHEDTYLDEVVGYLVAFLGISFQLTRGFVLPFPMNILLLPMTILEKYLVWIVNSK